MVPDVGMIVGRRFHYSKSEDGTSWEVTHWTDDYDTPDYVEFDPDDYDGFEDDDMETLEEEEQNAVNGRETVGEELDELKDDANLTRAQILKKYYGIDVPEDEEEAPAEPEPEEEEAEEPRSGRSRRRRRKRSRTSSSVEDGGGAAVAIAASAALPAAEGAEVQAAKREKLSADAAKADDRGGGATPVAAAAAAPAATAAAAAAAGGEGEAVASPETTGGGGGGSSSAPNPTGHTFLDYFDPRNHEEETEIVSGLAEKKTSRVGEEYQCPLPAVESTYTMHPLVAKCTLQWRPPSEAEARGFDYAKYSSEVTARCAKPTLPLESALHTLFSLGFDGAAASAAVKAAGPFVGKAPWTEAERVAFEEGLLIEGKNFYRIHCNHVPSRTVRDHVEYYYHWKWTPHYDVFVGKNWGFGKFRRKHIYEPGRDVDDFDYERDPTLINPPSRMPSPMVQPIGDVMVALGGEPKGFMSSGELDAQLQEAVSGVATAVGIPEVFLDVDELAVRRATLDDAGVTSPDAGASA